jgi:hypothetical protein
MKGIDADRETVRRSLMRRKRAGIFKAKSKKRSHPSQQGQRHNYSGVHGFKPVLGFWDGYNSPMRLIVPLMTFQMSGFFGL